MAVSSKNLLRDVVKVFRDGIKVHYAKGDFCEICGTTENLHFHHFKSVSILIETWLKKRKITEFESLEHAQEIRQEFYSEHWEDMTSYGATLCKQHHEALHKVYGGNPVLGTASKQQRWVIKQKEKNGLVS